MKPHVIVFTEHESDTLARLVNEAEKRGAPIQRAADFHKFSAHEGAHAVPAPKPRKTVYKTTETERAVPTMVQRYNLADYLPEGA
jgi:hypothetical protein